MRDYFEMVGFAFVQIACSAFAGVLGAYSGGLAYHVAHRACTGQGLGSLSMELTSSAFFGVVGLLSIYMCWFCLNTSREILADLVADIKLYFAQQPAAEPAPWQSDNPYESPRS